MENTVEKTISVKQPFLVVWLCNLLNKNRLDYGVLPNEDETLWGFTLGKDNPVIFYSLEDLGKFKATNWVGDWIVDYNKKAFELVDVQPVLVVESEVV